MKTTNLGKVISEIPKEWLRLYKDYPKLFNSAVRLETIANKKYGLVGEISLKEKIKKWLAKECAEKDLFEENRHCLCEL